MSPWFVYCSCVCHCLWVCLVSLRISATYFLTLCGMGESRSPFFVSRFLSGLGLAWAHALSSSIRPLFPFIDSLQADQYSYHVTALLLSCYYLICACWASFGLAMYFSFLQFTLPSISAGLILIPSWASSAHSFPLGILSPLHSFGHPWPIPFLHSHGFL